MLIPGRPRPRIAVLVAVVATALTISGCGADARPASTSSRTAPDLASVTALADPRAWDGPSTARLAQPEVEPVAVDPDPELPVRLTDSQGTRVTVTDTRRVLALDVYGTTARTVFELGLGSRLVGRDTSTQFEEAADLPLVTSHGHDLSAEAILELDPTVILTDTTLGPWDVILQMRDAGIPVVVLPAKRSLDSLGSFTRQVAEALGVPAAGRALAERIEKHVQRSEAEIRKVAPSSVQHRLRTVFLYVRGKSGIYYMFGQGSGADSLIDSLGLYDVAEEIGWKGMKPVTDEGLIAAQPDVILMMSEGLSSVGGVDGLLDRLPALAQTPAGQQRRVVDMQDSQILGFGPLTGAVLNALAVAVYAPESVA